MNASISPAGLVGLADTVVALAANLFLQSSLLTGAGLTAAYLFRKKGAAVQSSILRATLVALCICPLTALALRECGMVPLGLQLPAGEGTQTLADAGLPMSARQPGLAAPAQTAKAPDDLDARGISEAADLPSAPKHAPAAAESTENARTQSTRSAEGLALLYCVLTAVWALGSSVLVAWLIVCHWRIGRLRWQGTMADVSVFEDSNLIARQLNVAPPQVLMHSDVKSPLLVGLLRPAILLPAMEESAHLAASPEVLTHELAHLARRDCAWHLLSRLATALLFFQPLLWVLARQLEETAEEVCDNYVIGRTSDRRSYAQRLVALAEQIQFPRAETVAGIGVVAFKSALGQRIARILDASRNLTIRTQLRGPHGN